MRHGFPPPAATESDSSKEEALASIPVAVPDLPDVLTERPEVVASLRQHLLGFMAQGQAVSVSSVKTSRVAAHGAGGVGKVIFAFSFLGIVLISAFLVTSFADNAGSHGCS